MSSRRNTYKYHFSGSDGRILHRGITNDLGRREAEHRRNIRRDGHISQVGRRTTHSAGLAWERRGGRRPRRTQQGWLQRFMRDFFG